MPSIRHMGLAAALTWLAGCLAPTTWPVAGSENEPRKRALIVSIAKYGAGTGWGPTNADNDLRLLRRLLTAQGFDEIHELRDAEATREGIARAFRERLLAPALPGDLAVFYYGGHGQQITDDGDDEIDGYDEALVPFDAPTQDRDGYRGEKHFRDDELHGLIQELRRKLGARGHVVAFLDSCFSGTPRGRLRVTRGGVTDEMVVRGGPPLGPPRRASAARESGTGVYEGPGTARGGHDQALASYVVFSAARHDELAYETVDDEGRPVGSLTYAFSLELAALRHEASYRSLYEGLLWQMARWVPNEPQVEGDVDRLLFDGELVRQEPFVAVSAVLSPRRVVLEGGWIAGLSRGAQVELHAAGTRQPAAASRLATGSVVEATPGQATVDLERAVDEAVLERARVFVTRVSFAGQEPLRVRLAVASDALTRRLRAALEAGVTGLAIGSAHPDVVVFSDDSDGSVIVETFHDQRRLLEMPVSTPDLEKRLTRRLARFARYRAWRGLDLRDPELPVDLELVRMRCPEGASRPSECVPDPAAEDDGPAALWRVGDTFRIRVHNHSDHPAYLHLVDLPPDGGIHPLWPPVRTGDKTPVPAGTARELPPVHRITEPLGREVVLLIASTEWLNLQPFLDNTDARGGGCDDPVACLDAARKSARDLEDAGAVSTSAVTLTIVTW